jgi:hypothetical protein
MKKYSAKLLFQFRVVNPAEIGARRTCEERIVTYLARNAKFALSKAKQMGQASCYDYENADGHQVYFEFIGIVDLLCLGIECRPEEVWYEIVDRVRPMERKNQLTRSDAELLKRAAH